jgi:hypothetical protein
MHGTIIKIVCVLCSLHYGKYYRLQEEDLHKLQYTLTLVRNEISSLLKMFYVTKELGNALDIIKLRKDRYKRAWQIKVINQMSEPAGFKIKELLKWRKLR